MRALRACDLDLEVRIVKRGDSDERLIEQYLAMTEEHRVQPFSTCWSSRPRHTGVSESMAEAPPFEPRNILRALVEHDVKFIVIGGLAAVFHGSPLRTGDADITPAADRDSLERLATALTELDARVYVQGIPATEAPKR